MSSEALTWIAPYIAEEIVGCVGVRITGSRWPDTSNVHPFIATLGRITKGLLSYGDPIILGFIESIWDDAMDNDYLGTCPTYIQYAVSHAYREVLNSLFDLAQDSEDVVSQALSDVYFYEQHWDFYFEVREVLLDSDLNDGRVTIIEDLYDFAITNNFTRVYEASLDCILPTVAFRHYKAGDSRVRAIVAQGIPIGGLYTRTVSLVIESCDFDDAIIEGIKTGRIDIPGAYTDALAAGRDDFAERIAQLM